MPSSACANAGINRRQATAGHGEKRLRGMRMGFLCCRPVFSAPISASGWRTMAFPPDPRYGALEHVPIVLFRVRPPTGVTPGLDPGLDPGVHSLREKLLRRRWIAGSSPAMTEV